jgi:folate-binding protein YgfZ
VAYEEGYGALQEGQGAFEFPRDVVRVSGPDAARYLQGQLSQDVAGLAPGEWAWALVLAPQGKLDVFVRAYRAGADEFILDTDAGVGPALVARLLRFRLRTKADVEQLPWRVVAVRGPEAVPGPSAGGAAGALVVPFVWGGLRGYDLLGAGPVAPAGAVAVSEDAYEAARVEAGFPKHGAELDERTIPAEAGLVEASVSFTKGCYTGQELVARIDSRGSNVPRHLRGLLLSGPAAPGRLLYRARGGGEAPAGGAPPEGEAQAGEAQAAEVEATAAGPGGQSAPKGREAGRLTSVALSPARGWVALGYVSRAVAPGETLSVAGEGELGPGPVQARVSLLPLPAGGR